MKKLTEWTTIYDDGHESVRMTDGEDNMLYWSYGDNDGELESCRWRPTQKTSEISSWLDAHRIDASTFPMSSNTVAWEMLLSKYRNMTVGALVEGVRESKQLAF